MSGVRPEAVISYGAMARKFEPLSAEGRWKTKRFGMDDFEVAREIAPSNGGSPDNDPFVDPRFPGGKYPGYGK